MLYGENTDIRVIRTVRNRKSSFLKFVGNSLSHLNFSCLLFVCVGSRVFVQFILPYAHQTTNSQNGGTNTSRRVRELQNKRGFFLIFTT
jgi:hypothetical protein